MFIILDQTQASYDAPDIFSGYYETLEDLKKELQLVSRNDPYESFTVLDTNTPAIGCGDCREYSQKEILQLVDNLK